MKSYKTFIAGLIGLVLLSWACEKVTLDKVQVQGEVKFTQDILPIFTNSCIGCHNGTVNPDLRADKAYNALVNGDYLNTLEPDQSKIYKQLTTNSSHLSKATELDKAKILQWITLGANND
jgi:hypothetical protein